MIQNHFIALGLCNLSINLRFIPCIYFMGQSYNFNLNYRYNGTRRANISLTSGLALEQR